MDDGGIWTTLTIFIGGVSTLAIFSFLVGENRFFRLFEHVFIGISAGLIPIATLKDLLWPKIISPMLGLNVVVFPDGTTYQPYMPLYLLYLIPIGIGLLYYTLYFPRYAWLSKIAIALTLGAGAGYACKGFFNEMLPQVTKSFKPLAVFSGGQIDLLASLSNIAFVSILLAVMYYFFFTFKAGDRTSKYITPFARGCLMVCFGAFFGSTVMARLALLVERLQFLVDDWWRVVSTSLPV